MQKNLAHGPKRRVWLHLFYNVFFSSMIHGDPACWNERNEGSERRHGSKDNVLHPEGWMVSGQETVFCWVSVP